MQRGITGIVAVVLLIGVAITMAVGLLFWGAGISTKQPVPPQPQPIIAIPLSNDYVTLKVLVANTGSVPIPNGTVLTIAENGVAATLVQELPPNSQALVSFVGYRDEQEHYFPTGQYTIYGAKQGQAPLVTVPTETPVALNKTTVSPEPAGDYNPVIEEANGRMYIAWDSLRVGGHYEIFTSNSTDGGSWSPAVMITEPQEKRNPCLLYNGTVFGLALDWMNPANLHIWTKVSVDGTTWGSKLQAESESNDNKQPTMMIDAAGRYWIAWASSSVGNYDIYTKKATSFSTFGGQPDYAVTLNTSSDTYPSMIQGGDGIYWIAFQSDRGGSNAIWLSRSVNGTTWEAPRMLPARSGAMSPSLIQDSSGEYWLAYYTDEGLYSYMWIMHSSDLVSWSQSSMISREGVIEKNPFLMQDSDGTYWLVFEGSIGGNSDIYVRSTTNALYWE